MITNRQQDNLEMVHMLKGSMSQLNRMNDMPLNMSTRSNRSIPSQSMVGPNSDVFYQQQQSQQLIGGPRPQSLLVIPNHATEASTTLITSNSSHPPISTHKADKTIEDMLGLNCFNFPLDRGAHPPNHQMNYIRSLADMFACPHTNFPISVGLFSRVGTNARSTYLYKLVEELTNLTEPLDPTRLQMSPEMILFPLSVSIFLGYVFSLLTSWDFGLAVGVIVLITFLCVFGFILFGSRVREWDRAILMGLAISRFMESVRLLFTLLFRYPPESKQSKAIKVIFAHQNLSMYPSSNHCIVALVEKIVQGAERTFSCFITRIFRSLSDTESSSNRIYKRVCCCPTFLIVILLTSALIVNITLIKVFEGNFFLLFKKAKVMAIFFLTMAVIFLGLIGAIPVLLRTVWFLIRSPSRKLRAIVDSSNAEGEVNDTIMKDELRTTCDMISILDSYLGNRTTRIVVCVDASDTFNREKLVQFLHHVHSLMMSEPTAPLAVVIAADFQAILGDVEPDSASLAFSDCLHLVHTILHLPLFMEDPCFPLQQQVTANNNMPNHSGSIIAANQGGASFESLSTAVSGGRYPSYLDPRGAHSLPPMPQPSDSQSFIKKGATSGMNSPKTITELYTLRNELSDINTKVIKQLVAATAFTGRLLRIYQMDFKIEELVVWLEMAMNWPYQTAWWILYLEEQGDRIDTRISLCQINEVVTLRMQRYDEHLHELKRDDRDPEKLVIYLKSESASNISVAQLKRFIACSPFVNPYTRHCTRDLLKNKLYSTPKSSRKMTDSIGEEIMGSVLPPQSDPLSRKTSISNNPGPSSVSLPNTVSAEVPKTPSTVRKCLVKLKSVKRNPSFSKRRLGNYQDGYPGKDLSQLNIEEVCDMLAQIEGLSESRRQSYQAQLVDLNITGLVLSVCDMEQLRQELGMTFGDWQLFHTLVMHLRRLETMHEEEGGAAASSEGDAELHGLLLEDEEDTDQDETPIWKKTKPHRMLSKEDSIFMKSNHKPPTQAVHGGGTLNSSYPFSAGQAQQHSLTSGLYQQTGAQQPAQQSVNLNYAYNSLPSHATAGPTTATTTRPQPPMLNNRTAPPGTVPQSANSSYSNPPPPTYGALPHSTSHQMMPQPQSNATQPQVPLHQALSSAASSHASSSKCAQHPQHKKMSSGEAVALLVTEKRKSKNTSSSTMDLTPGSKRKKKLKLVRSLSQSHERLQPVGIYSADIPPGTNLIEYRRFIPVIYQGPDASDEVDSESECTCEYWYRMDHHPVAARLVGSEPASRVNSRPQTSPEMSDEERSGDGKMDGLSYSGKNHQFVTSGLPTAVGMAGVTIENNTNCEV